ncbi:hypothetical protein [Caldimonas brevitalea]|uniref:Uncharacterized protein n=1 Tax=Caldimonas brevitalea TaxID=413882 RepID=A0A0G3BHA1_9BURK|nr:hypothetical protein [Caldimonas brevitalea]AKJ28779.1 hypothetical protein AAW51_2088 [Caldimonas brevitalea]
MNCQQGDLAVIVGGQYAENWGRLVMVREAYNFQGIWDGDCGPAWYVESEGDKLYTETVSGRPFRMYRVVVRDSALRPIRNDDGIDEMVRIAGRPNYADAEPATRLQQLRQAVEEFKRSQGATR